MKNRALGNSRDHNKISSIHDTGVSEEERVGLEEYSERIMAEILQIWQSNKKIQEVE